MRDCDLVVSVAHRRRRRSRGQRLAPCEMRAALLRETCSAPEDRQRTSSRARTSLIDGQLGSYSVHLGSGVVHRLPGGRCASCRSTPSTAAGCSCPSPTTTRARRRSSARCCCWPATTRSRIRRFWSSCGSSQPAPGCHAVFRSSKARSNLARSGKGLVQPRSVLWTLRSLGYCLRTLEGALDLGQFRKGLTATPHPITVPVHTAEPPGPVARRWPDRVPNILATSAFPGGDSRCRTCCTPPPSALVPDAFEFRWHLLELGIHRLPSAARLRLRTLRMAVPSSAGAVERIVDGNFLELELFRRRIARR